MIVYSCYLVLISITLYVILISKSIYKKSHSLIPIVPILVIYLWSIHGAWTFIPFKLNGGTYFIEDMMYRVCIDKYYLLGLIYYSLFLFVFSSYEIIYIVNNHISLNKTNFRNKYLNTIDSLAHSKGYRSLTYFFLFFFLFCSFKDISQALSSGTSAYQISRWDSSTESINTFIAICGDTYLFLAIPLFFSRDNKHKAFLFISFALYYLFNLVLGNRAMLLIGGLVAILLYSELNGIKKIFKVRNILIAVFFLFAIQLISIFRGFSVDALFKGGELNISFSDIMMSFLSSSEQYSAHLSMYGALKYDVDFTWGSSVLFFFSTLIPSFLGIPRPMAIYNYFIKNTVGSVDLGMTINNITGWYLNFGIIGIFIGAVLWGYLLKLFYLRRYKFIFIYGAIIFSSCSIHMIRDGALEPYKSVLILDTLIPLSIIYLFVRKAEGINNYLQSKNVLK